MVTKISSKSELNSLASKLVSQSTQLESIASELRSVLSSVSNYEDIDVKSAGSLLASNVDNIAADMDVISRGIQGYITDIEEFDKYDFNLDAELNKNKVVNNAVGGVSRGPSSSTPLSGSSVSVGSAGYSNSSKPIYSSTQNNSNVGSNVNNSEVNNKKDINKDASVLDRPIVNDKENDTKANININNDIVSNNYNNKVISNIQYTDNNSNNNNVSISESASNIDNSFVDTPVTDIAVDNNEIVDDQIISDVLDNEFSDDIYVNEQSGYIGGTNSNIVSDDISSNVSSNNGSAIPGILGGLGAAAVVGLGAVGGAKVIKNMKENQEIDDDEDE